MAESKAEKKAIAKAALAVRMELYREECKEAGKEIMFNGARLRSSAGR